MKTATPTEEGFDLEILLALLDGPEKSRKAADKAFERYKKPVMAFVGKKYPSLNADEQTDVVHDAFMALYERGMEGRVDDKKPLLGFLFMVAYRRGASRLKRSLKEEKAADEYCREMAALLNDTDVGRAWEKVAMNGYGREVQSLFCAEIQRLPRKQRMVAQIIADGYPEYLKNQEIREELQRRFGGTVTLAETKSALQVVWKKMKDEIYKKIK